MSKNLYRIATTGLLAGAFSLPMSAAPSAWQIDPHHAFAQFAVKHLMISTVRGEFRGVSGTVLWDSQDISKSTVNVTIDTATVETNDPQRNAHLKSPDFFDVVKYPTMTFKSKKVEQIAADKLRITGDLTIRGVTKEVALNVDGPTAAIKDPWGNTRAALNATAKINRQDFGVKWNANMDGGGVVVGDDVLITIDLELIKQAAAKSGD